MPMKQPVRSQLFLFDVKTNRVDRRVTYRIRC
jgi:hypothetical protein